MQEGANSAAAATQATHTKQLSILSTIGGKRATRLPSSRPDLVSEASRNTPNTGQNPSLQSFGATKNSLKNNGTPQAQFADATSQYLFGNAKIGKSPASSGQSKNVGSAKLKRENKINKEESEAQTGDNQSEFEGSPTFNHNSESVNTPQRSNIEVPGDYSRKSVPSPSNQLGSRSKNSKRRNDSRGNSANLLRSPVLQLDMSKKQQSNPISTIKKTMNDNPIAIGKVPNKNDRADTDEESAQFVSRPSAIDSQDQSGYLTGQEIRRRDLDAQQQQQQQVSGYNSGYSSGASPSPRVARFKAKAAGIRKQWQKKSIKRKSSKNTEYIKVQESLDQQQNSNADIPPSSDLGTVNEQDGEQSQQQNQEARNQALVNYGKVDAVTTPTPNTHNISDMNPMLSQTTSHRGSHVVPQNFTLSGQLVPEQKQFRQQAFSNNKKKLQRKKSFSSNEFQDQLRQAQIRNPRGSNPNGDDTLEDDGSQTKSNYYSTSSKIEKIEVEIQKTGPIKHIVKPGAGATANSAQKPLAGRSPRVQAKRGAQGQANQGTKKRGKQVINRGLVKGQQAEKATSSVGNPSTQDKSTKDEGLTASISETQHSNTNAKTEGLDLAEQQAATGAIRPKGKAIDPYVKGEHQQRSFQKLTEENEITPEQYQEMIEQFMQDQEQQFEVFETGPDGEFKPIFMVGKCPPPEKEMLKQSILSTLSNRSLSRGGTPRGRDPHLNQNQFGEISSGQNIVAPKFMPGSISHVSGGMGNTALSVIQSESKEETERSTVQNVPAISGIVSKKQLHTQEASQANPSAARFAEIKSDQSGAIDASAVAGPDLNKSIQIVENNAQSRNVEIAAENSKFNSQRSKNNMASTSNYDVLLAAQQSHLSQGKRVPARNSGIASNTRTLPNQIKRGQLQLQSPSMSVKQPANIRAGLERESANRRPADGVCTPRGDQGSRKVSPRRSAQNQTAPHTQKELSGRPIKATVKRIGVDLNGQGRQSGRKSSAASARRQGTLTSRQSQYQEAAKSVRKGSMKTKRASEQSAGNVYNQMGGGRNNQTMPVQPAQARRPVSTNARAASDTSQARRNNGKQPKNSEIKTVSLNFDANVRNNSALNRRGNNNDLSEMDVSLNESQPNYYATVRTSHVRDSMSSTVQKALAGRKSFANNQSTEINKPAGLGQMPLAQDLTERLLEDYDHNPRLGQANKKDKNFVRAWEKVLEKFDKKTFQINNQKDFKALTRSINLVPNFTSEYRASQVFAAHEQYMSIQQERPMGQPLKKFETLRCIFLLFSVSTSIQDIQLYGPGSSAGGAVGLKNESETAGSGEFRDLTDKLQNVGKGANIYELDLELASRMNDARNRFLKQWIKQQVKLGGKN